MRGKSVIIRNWVCVIYISRIFEEIGDYVRISFLVIIFRVLK